MQLTERPALLPGASILGYTHGPVVDTGVELPIGGRVYINRTEAGEIARFFDFATPDAVGQLRNRIKELEEELDQARATIRQIRESVTAAL